MTQEEIEDIILMLLAELAGCTAAELRAELSALGLDMPVDSLLAVEILVKVQDLTGTVLPATEQTAEALLTVRGFAAAVRQQLDEQASGQASA